MKYLEWSACTEAGLDLWKWVNNEYPVGFKASVVAFYNLKNLVAAHGEAAKGQYLARKTKKGR